MPPLWRSSTRGARAHALSRGGPAHALPGLGSSTGVTCQVVLVPGGRGQPILIGMVPLSGRDLAPAPQGGNAGQALRNALDLTQHAEALGYARHWRAEHRKMPGTASAATTVAPAHIAAAAQSIRLGAGRSGGRHG